MSESKIQVRSPARDGEPCEQCGSPLAADQRYCLNCGQRRGDPRVDYRQRMSTAATGADAPEPAAARPAAEPEPVQPEKRERDYAPLAAVGGIAVLGLMLLVGVLIGKGDSGAAPAPAPVVVQGGGEAGASSGGEGAGTGDEAAGGSSLGTSAGGKSKGKKKGGGETPTDAGAVTASQDQLEDLQSETGEEAAKNALKLPDKIATPGAPPPIDKSKPPGGGEGGDGDQVSSDLERRRDRLAQQLIDLQWDLGGIAYEMATRDHYRLDVLNAQAAKLQQVDAELAEVERMLKLGQAAAAGACPNCGALYAQGAVFCWQCGKDLMPRGGEAAAAPPEASAR